MNPLDEYLSCRPNLQKEAVLGSQQVLSGLQRYLGSAAMSDIAAGARAAGGAVALYGLVGVARKAHQALTKKRDFTAMLEANPDLQQYQEENPQQFNHHYNSMRGTNPSLAADPVVSGTMMRQMSQQPQVAGRTLVEYMRSAPRGSSLDISMGGGKPSVGVKSSY